jgi:hypothetical protein
MQPHFIKNRSLLVALRYGNATADRQKPRNEVFAQPKNASPISVNGTCPTETQRNAYFEYAFPLGISVGLRKSISVGISVISVISVFDMVNKRY